MQNAQRYNKHPKRIHILLDLDNTLISSISKEEEKSIFKPRMKFFTWKEMEGYYKIFERPGLQKFLDFLFQNFNVSVWTAASKSYALFIIENFILVKPNRRLNYIFFSHHCKHSKRIKNTQKSIQMLVDEYKLHEFNKNVYIIDDHPEVFNAQPDKCLHIKAFEFTDRKSFLDDELLQDIIPKLEKILTVDKYFLK
jgi:TFIIF-interacting CTD phosphatase-like protein